MNYRNDEKIVGNWHGYLFDEGEFMGREYILVRPKVEPNGKWALKTEYFDAFPETEFALLEKGYHIAHVDTIERYCPDSTTEAQAAFVDFVHEKYGLSAKCVPIGMSCGGLQAIYLGAKFPEKVSCMFMDAPLVNFLSCPFGLGQRDRAPQEVIEEFIRARGVDEIGILSFREHPLDYIPQLVKNNIPLVLVLGGDDMTVPFEENAKPLIEAYEKAGAILETHIVPGRVHHPHGLEDPTPVVEFIEKYAE